MGIITLGIGGKTPRITYLTTSGLAATGAIASPTISGTLYGPAATGVLYGPASAGSIEGESRGSC